EFRPHPQITVGRLRNGSNLPRCKAFAKEPCRMCVLIDIKRGVQRGYTRATQQSDPERGRGRSDNRSPECVAPLHDYSEGLCPSDSPHAFSRAASTARFRLRAKRYGETSPKPWRRRAVRVARFAALARVVLRAALPRRSTVC